MMFNNGRAMSEELHTFPFPILKVFIFINEHTYWGLSYAIPRR